MAYLAGNIARFIITFTTESTSALVNPTTVQFSYNLSGGATLNTWTYGSATTPAVGVVARTSTGVYEVWVDTTGMSGTLNGDWLSTGTGAAAAIDSVSVGSNVVNANPFTLGSMIDDTFRQLRGTMREEINTLSGTLDAPAAGTIETITFNYALNGITVGSLLAISEETMFVLGTNTTSYTATVIRGYDDTTPVATTATGAQVSVNPPWTRSVVRDRLRDELRSWAPQVYRVAHLEIPIVSMQRGYDLAGATGIIRVMRVTAPQPPYIGAAGYWQVGAAPNGIDVEQANPEYAFTYRPDANPSQFPSGKALIITQPSLPNIAGNYHIVYAATFDVDTAWNDTVDMIGNVGLDSRDLDIPALGATARLLRMVSVRRAMLNVQGQSRSDQDVTMQSILQSAQQFEADRDRRLGDAQERLFGDWPIRVSTS